MSPIEFNTWFGIVLVLGAIAVIGLMATVGSVILAYRSRLGSSSM